MAISKGVGPVSTVWHSLSKNGETIGHVTSDLIYVAGVPTVVLEWKHGLEGDIPGVTVALHFAGLHRVGWPNAEFMYDFNVNDTRISE